MIRQSLAAKRSQQQVVPNPASVAVLQSEDKNESTTAGLARNAALNQSENAIGNNKVVKMMSRKSTIDTKDGNNKMVVVLEKNRAGS